MVLLVWFYVLNVMFRLCKIVRSSRLQMFYKIVTLRNFAKFTGKHQYRNLLYNNVSGWKRELNFKAEFCEISKTIYFIQHPRTVASEF